MLAHIHALHVLPNANRATLSIHVQYKPGNSNRSDSKTNNHFAFAPWSPGPAIRDEWIANLV